MPSAGPVAAPVQSSSPRILIVEDDGLLALDMEVTLEASGFRVVGQADSEERAVAAAFRERPDIVLMDIRLADGDGISAARTIMGESHVCLIFISGNSDAATQAAATGLKPAGFIAKPYNARKLPTLVLQAYHRFLDANEQ